MSVLMRLSVCYYADSGSSVSNVTCVHSTACDAAGLNRTTVVVIVV